jgi:hypothetical protein
MDIPHFIKIITKGSYMKSKFTLSILSTVFVLGLASSNANTSRVFIQRSPGSLNY